MTSLRFVWINPDDVEAVSEIVEVSGVLREHWVEDPKETGEPYRYAEYYEFLNGGSAELFYTKRKSKYKLKDIRLSVPYDPEEEKRFNEEAGFVPKDGFDLLFNSPYLTRQILMTISGEVD